MFVWKFVSRKCRKEFLEMDIANLYSPFLYRIGLNRIALPILSKLLLHILFIFGTISLKTIVVEAQKELRPWRENRYIK
jgi:hypothetical protein